MTTEYVRLFCEHGRIIMEWQIGEDVGYRASWSITEYEAAQRHLAEKVKELVDQEALRRMSDLHGGNES